MPVSSVIVAVSIRSLFDNYWLRPYCPLSGCSVVVQTGLKNVLFHNNYKSISFFVSEMPKNGQKNPTTPGPLQRRFNTLSLETLNRISTFGEAQERVGGPHGVFTDNLSASSRAAPPPFVVRLVKQNSRSS